MVKFVEDELAEIKKEVLDMWTLVLRQMQQAQKAVVTMDKGEAEQIAAHEKLVNSFDLKIDSMAEDFIALYTPVAVDLRFVLAMLNVNSNLERIGDYADGLARFVMRSQGEKPDGKLFEELRLPEMFTRVITMLEQAKDALEREDAALAKSVIAQDDALDGLNADAIRILTDYAAAHPEGVRMCMELNGVFRKLERTGDHINNIVEDIVFYMDAKVLKHSGK